MLDLILGQLEEANFGSCENLAWLVVLPLIPEFFFTDMILNLVALGLFLLAHSH